MKLHQRAVHTVAVGLAVAALAACGNDNNTMTPQFKSTIVLSDGSVSAPHTDANLKNGWGSRSIRPGRYAYRITTRRSQLSMTAMA
jgi:hypothetical protein